MILIINIVSSRLDHLLDIGVEAFWLSPVYKSPMADFGYDISDYRDIDPIFGTMEDFETLAVEAKARGLRIIMDFVPNHSSNQHEWFLRSEAREEPYTDYYIWRDAREMNSSNFSVYDLSHDSYLVSKVSYLISRVSYLVTKVSYLISCISSLIPGN